MMSQSVEEWNRHRDVITKLYLKENLPLKEVQNIMEKDYRFKATKRMYTIRLKRWGVCKNYRAQDKEAIAAEIVNAKAENRSLNVINFHDQPVKLHRVLRHCRSLARKRKREEKETVKEELEKDSNDEMGKAGDDVRMTEDDTVALMSGVVDGIDPWRESVRMATQQENGRDRSFTSTKKSTKLDGRQHYENLLRYLNRRQSPQFSIPFGTDDANLEIILTKTEAYYEAHFLALDKQRKNMNSKTGMPANLSTRGLNLIDSESVSISEAYSRNFWIDIKSAIYFLKKDSANLAWPLFNKVCRSAGDVLISNPFNFLKELFSTLSPVNIKMHAPVRMMLLRYLKQVAMLKLGIHHPMSGILHQLQFDAGCREVSEIGLRFILELHNRHLDVRHGEVFQLRRALVVLLRRDYDLAAAERAANNLVNSSTSIYGVEAEETLLAMTELVHLYSDQADYDRALELAVSVIERYKKSLGSQFPDDRAAYAMENVAELYRFKGDDANELRWLRRALDAAWTVRGGSASTTFVRSKLEKVLHRLGRVEEAVRLGEIYPEDARE